MVRKRTPAGDAQRPLGTEEIVVLPEQLVTPARRKLDGVRVLMTAVLKDGIETFIASYPTAGRSRRGVYEETAAWLLSEDGRWPFSFVSLCEALDIDAASLRAGILRWKAAQSRRRQTLPTHRAARIRFSAAA